jgi:hypothetical protein
MEVLPVKAWLAVLQIIRKLKLYLMTQERLPPETYGTFVLYGTSKTGLIKFWILGASTQFCLI